MVELLTRLNGLDRGASESERFIDRLVTGAEEADFTMEQVFRLCDIEPEHCEEVFMALEHSVAEKSKPLIIKACVHGQMKGFIIMLLHPVFVMLLVRVVL